MAFRSLLTRMAATNSFRIGIDQIAKPKTYASSTMPKFKPYAPTTTAGFDQSSKSKASRGDFVPIYVTIGMIALSVTLGLHTAKQQLIHSPSVRVRKKRRETISEVVEPEKVADEAEKFFSKSFFRKVAHVQEFEKFRDPYDSIHGDAFAHPHRVETLKSVGIDPTAA